MNQLTEPVYYFAYGSNMNPLRVIERELDTVGEPLNAFLSNFELRFNKISRYRKGSAAANISPAYGAVVHGVAYRLVESIAIESMDVFERSPEDYAREAVFVRIERTNHGSLESCVVPAWTYIAKPHVVDEELKPTRQYIEHLLASPFLSEAECAELRQIDCLNG